MFGFFIVVIVFIIKFPTLRVEGTILTTFLLGMGTGFIALVFVFIVPQTIGRSDRTIGANIQHTEEKQFELVLCLTVTDVILSADTRFGAVSIQSGQREKILPSVRLMT